MDNQSSNRKNDDTDRRWLGHGDAVGDEDAGRAVGEVRQEGANPAGFGSRLLLTGVSKIVDSRCMSRTHAFTIQ